MLERKTLKYRLTPRSAQHSVGCLELVLRPSPSGETEGVLPSASLSRRAPRKPHGTARPWPTSPPLCQPQPVRPSELAALRPPHTFAQISLLCPAGPLPGEAFPGSCQMCHEWQSPLTPWASPPSLVNRGADAKAACRVGSRPRRSAGQGCRHKTANEPRKKARFPERKKPHQGVPTRRQRCEGPASPPEDSLQSHQTGKSHSPPMV